MTAMIPTRYGTLTVLVGTDTIPCGQTSYPISGPASAVPTARSGPDTQWAAAQTVARDASLRAGLAVLVCDDGTRIVWQNGQPRFANLGSCA